MDDGSEGIGAHLLLSTSASICAGDTPVALDQDVAGDAVELAVHGDAAVGVMVAGAHGLLWPAVVRLRNACMSMPNRAAPAWTSTARALVARVSRRAGT